MNDPEQIWHIVTLETSANVVEELESRIRDQFGRATVQVARPGSNVIWLEIYFEQALEAELFANAMINDDDVVGKAIRVCKPRDWQSFWRHHFKPLELGRRLTIVPAWEPQAYAVGRQPIVINPGLSFGTGANFTTRFCLETIEHIMDRYGPFSLLDVGAGSGILAITAALLGCSEILAVDHDPMCLTQTSENAKLNGVHDRIRVSLNDVLQNFPQGRYDLVCANLYLHLLEKTVDALFSTANRFLVLSGIRDVEADRAAAPFLASGAKEFLRDSDGEWCGIAFEK